MDDTGRSEFGALQEGEGVKPDSSLPAYRYARALCEQARNAASPKTSSFKSNRDFRLGKDHWRMPATAQAMIQNEWQCKSIDNLLYACIDNKAAVIGKGELSIIVEDLEDQTSYYDRLLVAETLRHEAERLHWRRIRDDLYIRGSDTGVGVVMTSVKPDNLTGDMMIQSKVLPSEELFPDPEYDNEHDCKFMVWDTVLSMSTLRAMFPSKAPFVKPDIQTIGSQVSGITYKNSQNPDDNLIYGGAQEFAIDSQGKLNARKARVSFVWINDTDSIIEELRNTVLREDAPGYQCTACSHYFYAEDLSDDSTDCPDCSAPLVEATVPAQVRQDKVVRRQYPYGRLIVYTGDTLLYDGDNPHDIEGCFPFSVYHHYLDPGNFYGFSDVALLRSNQEVRDVTVGQGVDYLRLAIFGPFEYPVGAIAYSKLGNGPGQPYPVKNELCGKARFITPDGMNVQAWQAILGYNQNSFHVVSGFSDLAQQFAGSPQPSATAVEATTQSTGGRMDAHVRRMEDAMSDWLSHVYQLGHQHYTTPRNVNVKFPNATMKSVQVEWQKLPKNVRVRVSINTEKMTQDKILGQNVAKLAEAGMLQVPQRVLLESLGFPPSRIRDIENQQALEAELKEQEMPEMPEQIPMPIGGMDA